MIKSPQFSHKLAARHKIDTAAAERIVRTFPPKGKRQDTKHTDVQSGSHSQERKEPSHQERSTIRYTQRRDTRDATSDRERWKVTERGREIRERLLDETQK